MDVKRKICGKGKSCKPSCERHVRAAENSVAPMLHGWSCCIIKPDVPRTRAPQHLRESEWFSLWELSSAGSRPEDGVSSWPHPPTRHRSRYASCISPGSLNRPICCSTAPILVRPAHVTGGQWCEWKMIETGSKDSFSLQDIILMWTAGVKASRTFALFPSTAAYS